MTTVTFILDLAWRESEAPWLERTKKSYEEKVRTGEVEVTR